MKQTPQFCSEVLKNKQHDGKRQWNKKQNRKVKHKEANERGERGQGSTQAEELT